MKIVPGAVAVVVCVLAAVLMLMPSDVVESRYASLADARADHLFGRGWLPDILPASARDIRVTNNLDLNLSDGEFSFKSADAAAFVSRVQPYHQIEDREALVAKMRRKGFTAYSFIDGRSSWIFFCKADTGYCRYTMWYQ